MTTNEENCVFISFHFRKQEREKYRKISGKNKNTKMKKHAMRKSELEKKSNAKGEKEEEPHEIIMIFDMHDEKNGR